MKDKLSRALRRGIPPHSRPRVSVLNDHWEVIGPAGKDPLSPRRVDVGGGLTGGCCGFAWPRHVDRQQQTGAQQQSREIVRRSRQMDAVAGRDGNLENLREKNRARQTRNAPKRTAPPHTISLRSACTLP